jgi:plasmid stabilization system protein ParE
VELEPRDEFAAGSGQSSGQDPSRDDNFERELKQALERRPAPPRLRRRVLEAAQRRREAGHRAHVIWWQRIAAGVLLAAVAGGAAWWRQEEVRRKGEAARMQVLTALRITGHALNEINTRLAARDEDDREK